MIGLKKQLKENDLKKIYLFYGEEDFLIQYYMDEIKKKLLSKEAEMMNYELIEGEKVEIPHIIDAAETLPFMHPNRFIVIKNTGLLIKAKDTSTQQLISFLGHVPDTTYMLFAENKVDRRNALFKAVKKFGYVVEFQHPSEKELTQWVMKVLKSKDKIITKADALYLVQLIGNNMEQLMVEIEKLSCFQLEEENIMREDIDAICTPSIELKIFELVDSIGSKQVNQALQIYHNLAVMNEPPIRILFMITRQFRLIYQVKLMREAGFVPKDMGKKIGVQSFIVKKCLAQSEYFSAEKLKQALEEGLQIDLSIKKGKIDALLGVELLITEYGK